MDTIIGWVASLAALLLISGAIYTLLWSQPQVLDNWKIKWSLLAGGGLIGLVLITSSFNALFGTSHEGAATAEPRSWYRIKPAPSEPEIRSGLTYSGFTCSPLPLMNEYRARMIARSWRFRRTGTTRDIQRDCDLWRPLARRQPCAPRARDSWS